MRPGQILARIAQSRQNPGLQVKARSWLRAFFPFLDGIDKPPQLASNAVSSPAVSSAMQKHCCRRRRPHAMVFRSAIHTLIRPQGGGPPSEPLCKSLLVVIALSREMYEGFDIAVAE